MCVRCTMTRRRSSLWWRRRSSGRRRRAPSCPSRSRNKCKEFQCWQCSGHVKMSPTLSPCVCLYVCVCICERVSVSVFLCIFCIFVGAKVERRDCHVCRQLAMQMPKSCCCCWLQNRQQPLLQQQTKLAKLSYNNNNAGRVLRERTVTMGLQLLASLSLGRRFRICSAHSRRSPKFTLQQNAQMFLKCSRRPKAGQARHHLTIPALLSSKDRLAACIMHVVCNNLCCMCRVSLSLSLSLVYCHCASIRYTRTLRASQSALPGSRLLHAKTNVHRYNSIFCV